METSTPKMNYRTKKEEVGDISPISKSPIFNLSNSGNVSCEEEIVQNMGPAGLSPELRRLLIKPRNKTEAEEMKLLLEQTVNLTRAALARGIIRQSNSMPNLELE